VCCYSGLVVVLGFATLKPDPPQKYSESEDTSHNCPFDLTKFTSILKI